MNFPAGTYLVRVVAPADSGAFAWPQALIVYPNVTLQGAGSGSSIIRLRNNAGLYGSLIGPSTIGGDINNFRMYDLGIDANGQNNPASYADLSQKTPYKNSRFENGVYAVSGNHLHVERCHFSNVLGIWTVNFVSDSGGVQYDITVADNVFDNVGTGIGAGYDDYDVSTIFVNGDSINVLNNQLYTRSGPGTRGERSAIEVHGTNIAVANNKVYGFRYGLNIGGNSATGHNMIHCYNNLFQDVATGVALYADVPDNKSDAALLNCSIHDNDIRINVDGWSSYPGGAGYPNGITFAQDGPSDRDAYNINLVSNSISYSNYGSTVRSVEDDQYGAGIRIDRRTYAGGVGRVVGNLRIQNNMISHPLGNGIYLSAPLTISGEISGNTILDPGSSPKGLYEAFLAPLFVGAFTVNLQVTNNTFQDDRSPVIIPYGIYAVNDVYGYCTATGNRFIDGFGNNLNLNVVNRVSGIGSWDTTSPAMMTASKSPGKSVVPMTSASLTSPLALLDSDANCPVSSFNPLLSGQTFNLAHLPSNLAVRAAAKAGVGSLGFTLQSNTQTRTGTINGTFGAFSLGTLTPGNVYGLTVTPYTSSNGTGTAGIPRNIAFHVVNNPVLGANVVTAEQWNSISGTSTSSIPLAHSPTTVWRNKGLRLAPTGKYNYGRRLRGYLTAPATGSYTFWAAGDDSVDLFLSSDSIPEHKVRIAYTGAWTNVNEWGKYSSQKSTVKSLIKGKQYYFEVLQKQGDGSDHVEIGWAKPGQGTASPSEIVPIGWVMPY